MNAVDSNPEKTALPDSQLAIDPKKQEISNTVLFIAFCLYFLLCSVIDFRLRALAADDSYIHLRIARHLFETGHAYFNNHEKVMVSSSPVWTLLLALIGLVNFGDLGVVLLEALSTASACLLTLLFVRQYLSTLVLNPVVRILSLVLPPTLLFLLLLQSSIDQMETTLAITFLFAGCYALEKEKVYWLALLALAGFTRYEYFVLAIALTVIALVKRRLTWKAFHLAATVVCAGVVWLLVQYGTLIPNTVRAKAAGYVVTYRDSAGGLSIGKIAAVLLCASLVVMLSKRTKSKPSLPAILVGLGLLLDILYIAKRTFIFTWYRPLALAPIVLGLMLGMIVSRRGWEKLLIAATILLLVREPVTFASQEIWAAASKTPWTDSPDVYDIRVAEYRAIGSAIYQVCPTARLMTSEIGGLGDGFRGEILDGFGLATPAAIKYHPMRVPEERSSGLSGSIPFGFVQEAHPDVIVSYRFFAEDVLRKINAAAYADLVFQPLPRAEMAHYGAVNNKNPMHILVAKDGACSSTQIDSSVRAALQAQ
jgi:hypothetical protein